MKLENEMTGDEYQELAEINHYLQKVVEERDALDEKIQKLEAMIASKKMIGIDQARLIRQRLAMVAYSNILGERIKAFLNSISERT